MGAKQSKVRVPKTKVARWETMHGRRKESFHVSDDNDREDDIEKGCCKSLCKKSNDKANYGSSNSNNDKTKKKKKKKEVEEPYIVYNNSNNNDDDHDYDERRQRSRFDGQSSRSVSSGDDDDDDEQYANVKIKSSSSKKKSRDSLKTNNIVIENKKQMEMNAKLYDLEKQEMTRKRMASEEELEKGKRMFLCSGSPWAMRVLLCFLLILVVVMATILGTELHYYERGMAYLRGETYEWPIDVTGMHNNHNNNKKIRFVNNNNDFSNQAVEEAKIGEDEEDDENIDDDEDFDENFDNDGGAGMALSVNEREINMAKKLMQKVKDSKTLPRERKKIELFGLNETLANLQSERKELMEEFESIAKVGHKESSDNNNKNFFAAADDRDKTGAYYNANKPFRFPWGGSSKTSHKNGEDDFDDSSRRKGLTEDVPEEVILRGERFDGNLNRNTREDAKLSVSDFITKLKDKEGVKGWSRNVRDTVASDDFASRIARSMVNDVRGVSDMEDILWSHSDDVAMPKDSEINDDEVLSRLELEKKLNAVEQSLAEEKGKDEWLARTAAKNSVEKFMNEADLRGRVESGEIDAEVLNNLIAAVTKSEKSNLDKVNTVENDVLKKLHPEKKVKKMNKNNSDDGDDDEKKKASTQVPEEKKEESHPMSLDDLFELPTDDDDDGKEDNGEKKNNKKKKKSSMNSNSKNSKDGKTEESNDEEDNKAKKKTTSTIVEEQSLSSSDNNNDGGGKKNLLDE